MILIVAKFHVKPEHADFWPDHVAEFTAATRAEPGNLWFDWSRDLQDPNRYVLVEAFTDDGAGPHVDSDHFRKAQTDLPRYLVETPEIINTQIDREPTWDRLGEMSVEG